MKIRVTTIILFLIMPGVVCPAAAQNSVKDSTENYLQAFTEKISQVTIANKISNIQDLRRIEQHGSDEETADLLRTLRNPFTSQLPLPAPEPETVTLIPRPTSVPTGEQRPTSADPVAAKAETPVELSKPTFKISGIVWNTNRPQAIIEGKILDVGAQIENWTIVAIGRNGVRVKCQNYEYILGP